MYEIRSAGAKGLGVFANRHIPRGTRIFSERPLLGITHGQSTGDIFVASGLLSLKDRRKVLELSSHATRESSVLRWNQALWFTVKSTTATLRSLMSGVWIPFPRVKGVKEHVTILSIFRSNAFAVGEKKGLKQAVFENVSRINHSCLPNAQGNFHEGLGRFNVHATRDIGVDEELTLNYLHERGAMRDSRQGKLLEGYGFSCACPACDLGTVKGEKGEEKRMRVHEMLANYAEGIANGGKESSEGELGMIWKFIGLFESEGIKGREVAVLYFEASKLNKKLGRYDKALECAERGLEIDRDCLGEDHVLYLKGLEVVEKLKGLARSSKNRMTCSIGGITGPLDST